MFLEAEFFGSKILINCVFMMDIRDIFSQISVKEMVGY